MSNIHVLKNEMIKAFGDNLVSFVLYGQEHASILVLFNTLSYKDLMAQKKLLKQFKNLMDNVHYFLVDEFIHSADVFPVEFLAIKQEALLVHGHDKLKDVVIDKRHLRHECEYIFRSNVLKLRSGFCLNHSPTVLIRESLKSYFMVFHVLHELDNRFVSILEDKEALLTSVSSQLAVDLTVFKEIYTLPQDKTLDAYFDAYLMASEAIANRLNDL